LRSFTKDKFGAFCSNVRPCDIHAGAHSLETLSCGLRSLSNLTCRKVAADCAGGVSNSLPVGDYYPSPLDQFTSHAPSPLAQAVHLPPSRGVQVVQQLKHTNAELAIAIASDDVRLTNERHRTLLESLE
jgi:hypothetical protein